MSKRSAQSSIRLRGVRQHNLKNVDLDLPLGRLIVFTGLSGSGKSSLAFDTLYAEGQRRYIETFSPYARQFFDRMDKPAADRIEGIPPAIAIEQRNAVKTTRSTVGTMTELCDYLKNLWPHISSLHCRGCGEPVRREPPLRVWEAANTAAQDLEVEILVTFDLQLSEKLSLKDSLELVARQGYQRLLLSEGIVRVADLLSREELMSSSIRRLTVIQDRLTLKAANRARFVEACEQAYHFGKGRLAIRRIEKGGTSAPIEGVQVCHFSNRHHCARCDIDYRDPSPALFSFNHPLGACPKCKGFGRIISIDYDLAVPDRSLSIRQGVVKPWRSGFSAECLDDLVKFCRQRNVPTDVAFRELPQQQQDWVINGDPDYGTDANHQWPKAWYGVKGYFRWLEGKAYKMHVRVLLSRYRSYELCPDCNGDRLQPESLLYTAVGAGDETKPNQGLTLAQFYRLPIRDAFNFIERISDQNRLRSNDPVQMVLGEVHSRLRYLVDIGLGYLSLDRPTRSLSGGETERVNLTTCLGTRLVNTLFVLDEPSVGLHPRDTSRLISLLHRLRDAGNTVVVVEHESSVIQAGDQVVDLGPGHGESGGEVVFQGRCADLLKARHSLTGDYLSGRKKVSPPKRRPVPSGENLILRNATRHNLRNLTVEIPLRRFVCVSGVSGSGKTTLVREVLLPAIHAAIQDRTSASPEVGDSGDDASEAIPVSSSKCSPSVELAGHEHLTAAILVDQSPLGKTPRSTPAVYTGAFDHIREVFASSELASQRGLNASAFSFNSSQGQCQRCRGAGFEKVEMQFLSDVFIRCPECNGRRYRSHILDVRLATPKSGRPSNRSRNPTRREASIEPWNIADLLEATVDDAVDFLSAFSGSKPAERAIASLRILQDVGLGYLRTGQPINTLSGGESQRLKLSAHLADILSKQNGANSRKIVPAGASSTLFIFDEPTTGLHFDDVRCLLQVFQKLVDTGHSVVVVEHNLDVIRSADWVIDMGPEAGDQGGQLVAAGTPESIQTCPLSHTGRALLAESQART